MKKKDIQELQSKTVDELKNSVRTLQMQIANLEVDFALGKEKNTAQKKNLGRDLARMLTVLSTTEKNMVQSAPTEKVAENKGKEKGK